MPRVAGNTRSALLDAALDAFAGKGFAGASIREITRVVGVRESAFYAHFPSKRAVYDELFAEGGPTVAARALDTLENEPPQVFLPQFAAMVIEAWSAPRARKFAAMMMRDAFDGDAQGWKTMRTAIYGVIALLVKRMEAWQKARVIRSDVSAETLAFEFIAPIAMARFIFFNIAAGKPEAARGREIIKQHALSFVALTATPKTRAERA